MSTNSEELNVLLGADSSAIEIDPLKVKESLAQLHFSPAAQNLILDPGSFNQENGLNSIVSSNDLLIQVRTSLTKIIDTIQNNPSMISKVTRFWGDLSTVEKILGGVLVSVPAIVLGPFADIGILLALGSISTATYISGGMILQDHYEHTEAITQKAKEGILCIGDVLVLTIASLDTIRQKLSIEVDKFEQENKKLTERVNDLSEDVDNLRVQIESLKITVSYLEQTRVSLENIAETLKQDLNKNRAEYDKTIKLIEQHRLDEQILKETLKAQIITLNIKVSELEVEIGKSQALAETLQGTVSALSTAVIKDKEQRQQFQDNLNGFLKNKEKNFIEVAGRMSKLEEELQKAKERFEAHIEEHKQLMEKQGMLITMLAHVQAKTPDNTVMVEENIDGDNITTIVSLNAPNSLDSLGFLSTQRVKYLAADTPSDDQRLRQ